MINEDGMLIETEPGEPLPNDTIIWVSQGFRPMYDPAGKFSYGIFLLKKVLYYETKDAGANLIKYEFYKNDPLTDKVASIELHASGPFFLNEISLFDSKGKVIICKTEPVNSDKRLYYNEIAPIFQGTELVWNWGYLTNIQNALNTYEMIRPTANTIVYEYGSGTHYMFEPGRMTGVG